MMQASSDRTTWLALLFLLPGAALAIPGLVADDPIPHAAGTGWALLFALPAAVALAFTARPSLPRTALLFLPALLVALHASFLSPGTDTFEQGRALLLLALTITCFVGGSAFGPSGLRAFSLGAILLSLAFTLQAHLSPEGAGPLGNTGVLSQAALPGAVFGALALRSRSLLERILGATAALSFALHAGLTPVLAGALAFAVALVLAAVLAPAEARRASWKVASLALVAPLCLLLAPLFAEHATAEVGVPSNTGGAEVRLRIWSQLPELIADQPLAGVGPGQFRAAFPPYRDPLELELSTHGHRSDAGGEVEHAHSDWLQAFAEFGIVAGLAFALLLGLLALAAVRACRRSDPESDAAYVAFGPVALALLVNSTLHSSLSFEPAPALIAWVCLGALASRGRRFGESWRVGRWVSLVAAILLLYSIPPALRLIEHGEQLASRQRAAALVERELTNDPADSRSVVAEFWLREGRLLRAALEAAPDSPTALSLLGAHFANWESSASTRTQASEAWSSALAHRPHQVSALLGLGLLAEETQARRSYWERALALDPGHPTALQNLARLESLEGRPPRAAAYLDRLESAGHLDDALLRDLGARALLAGRTSFGTALLARLELPFDLTLPDDALALSKETALEEGRTLFCEALEATAHRLWGLENLARDELSFAPSKFRQALKISRRYLENGDAPTRLLLVASLALSGDEQRARTELETVVLARLLPADWDELPENARAALEALGVQPPLRAGL